MRINRSPRRPAMRGSVTQNTGQNAGRHGTRQTIRLRSRETTRFGFLMRLGALVGSVMLILVLAAWLWNIGWPQRQAEHLLQAGLRVTQKAQFEVKDIVVEGRHQTAKETLAAALGTGAGAPILGFNAAAAQTRISKLPWVASATVERRLPDTILVRLTERLPLARWQHEGRTVVIDAEGKELPEAKLDQFASLPLVVGVGAPEATGDLLEALKPFPSVTDKMTAAVRVSERRWDLHLQPKAIAQMPENDITGAMKRLDEMIVTQKILEHDVVRIDLRDPNPAKMTIEPAAAAPKPPVKDMRL